MQYATLSVEVGIVDSMANIAKLVWRYADYLKMLVFEDLSERRNCVLKVVATPHILVATHADSRSRV